MLNTVIMTSITNAKCSFSGNPSLKPSLIDHAKELPTITGAMALCDKKRTEKVTYGKSVAGFNFGLSELMRFIYKLFNTCSCNLLFWTVLFQKHLTPFHSITALLMAVKVQSSVYNDLLLILVFKCHQTHSFLSYCTCYGINQVAVS